MKATEKRKSIGILMLLLLGDIVALPILIAYYIIWSLWKLLIAVPVYQQRLLGVVRFCISWYFINYTGDEIGIGHKWEMKRYITEHYSANAWEFFDFITITILIVSFFSSLFVAAGMHTSQTWTTSDAEESRKTGYDNIDEGLEYLDGQLGQCSTRGKVNMLSDLFSGKLKL